MQFFLRVKNAVLFFFVLHLESISSKQELEGYKPEFQSSFKKKMKFLTSKLSCSDSANTEHTGKVGESVLSFHIQLVCC